MMRGKTAHPGACALRYLGVLLLFSLALGASASAQRRAGSAAAAASPFAGTWVLDQDQSTFEPLTNRPDRRTVMLDITGDEVTHTTETGRTIITPVEPFQEISTTRVSYTARFDGKEYPVPNSRATIRLKRVSATTFERTASTGKASETGVWSLSPDGRTLTVTTNGLDEYGMRYSSRQVYMKQ